VNGFVSLAITHIHEGFVELSGPEERDRAVGDHLSEHVEGGVSTLVEGSDPMFASYLATGGPVWVLSQVASGENVLRRGLEEWVYNDLASGAHLDISAFEDFGGGDDTSGHDDEVSFES